MALFQNAAQPVWQTDRLRFSGREEKTLRDISHASLLVFAAATVAAGVVAGTSLPSEFGADVSWSFIAAIILFPLVCGLLLKEVWQVRKLENRLRSQQAAIGFVGSALNCGDKTPAGLLIVSYDMRVRFANQEYLDSMRQGPEEVLGWKVQDVLSVEGLEDRVCILLAGSDSAASCCFDTVVRTGLSRERPVHITMTRIAPRQGEARVLVIIEDLHPSRSSRLGQPVEGYLC